MENKGKLILNKNYRLNLNYESLISLNNWFELKLYVINIEKQVGKHLNV